MGFQIPNSLFVENELGLFMWDSTCVFVTRYTHISSAPAHIGDVHKLYFV